MPTCYIVGAGDFTPRGFAPVPGDLVLAADGGYRALYSLGSVSYTHLTLPTKA